MPSRNLATHEAREVTRAPPYRARSRSRDATFLGQRRSEASVARADAAEGCPLGPSVTGPQRGLRDLYPFVLPELALEKIRFVHDVIDNSGAAAAEKVT